jgi:hypothetical protein
MKLSPDGRRLMYSTYVGGREGGDLLYTPQVDREGDLFAVGATASTDFPTTPGALQPSNAGGRPGVCAVAADLVVLELDPAGSALVYSTYLGGPGDECCEPGLAIDAQGDAYVVGPTSSHRFPTTRGAFQRRFAGGPTDLAVSKLDPTGSHLLYATYLGGSGDDFYDAWISVDSDGNAYLAATTPSPDFPVTRGAFQTRYGGGDLDGFVTKLNPQGSALVYSTFLGGAGVDSLSGALVDRRGHVYLGGGTTSTDFPVTRDAFQRNEHGGSDATISELSGDGSRLVFSSYWGGSQDDGAEGTTLDDAGNLYLTGCTSSTDFPVTRRAFQPALQGGAPLPFGACQSLPADAFVTKIHFNGRGRAGSVRRQ